MNDVLPGPTLEGVLTILEMVDLVARENKDLIPNLESLHLIQATAIMKYFGVEVKADAVVA